MVGDGNGEVKATSEDDLSVFGSGLWSDIGRREVRCCDVSLGGISCRASPQINEKPRKPMFPTDLHPLQPALGRLHQLGREFLFTGRRGVADKQTAARRWRLGSLVIKSW